MNRIAQATRPRWPAELRLPAGDLLRDRSYQRLWISILISSFGGQATLLAVPLTAAVLLHATPKQMGFLTAMEVSAFVLLSLPAGPGALIGGWLGEHVSLRAALGFAGGMALVLTVLGWRQSIIRNTRSLPRPVGGATAEESSEIPETQPDEFVPWLLTVGDPVAH
jgi:MFS family permease